MLEETFWLWATGAPTASPADGDNTGCGDYETTPCDTDSCWARSSVVTEDDADTDICRFCTEEQTQDCATHIMNYPGYFTLENYAWPPEDGFGELSVKLVENSANRGVLVMLSNHQLVDWPERDDMLEAIGNGIRANPITDSPNGFSRYDYTWDRKDIYFRRASIAAPWSWSEPVDTGIPGYVGGIVDVFTDFFSAVTLENQRTVRINDLELWFTTSAWKGDMNHTDIFGRPGEYGVYTASTSQHWTEVTGETNDTDIIVP